MSYHIKLYLVLINQQKLIYSWDIAKENLYELIMDLISKSLILIKDIEIYGGQNLN